MDTLFSFDFDEQPVRVKSSEWYTPARYIEAAREVMGGIDLDPASSAIAQQVVRATRFYTKEENGLALPWKAERVWLNPPYSSPDGTLGRLGSLKGSLKPFILKVVEEYTSGNIQQAILLVNSDTDSSWFVPLWYYPICFANHKVMFHRPGQKNEGQFFGTCFVYMGPHEQKFVATFSTFGPVTRCISPLPVSSLPTLWDTEAVS